jgi:hypothetical protein
MRCVLELEGLCHTIVKRRGWAHVYDMAQEPTTSDWPACLFLELEMGLSLSFVYTPS